MQEIGEVSELSRSKEEFFNKVYLKMEGFLAGEVVLIILSIAEGNIIIIKKNNFVIIEIVK